MSVPSWLREPLLHFVLLGGALFALDHTLVSRQDDPRVLVQHDLPRQVARAGASALATSVALPSYTHSA